MLKCPMPGCGVVITPKSGFTNDAHKQQQRTGLINHLKGGKSSWEGCDGHSISAEDAELIVDKVCALTVAIEKALKSRRIE